MYLHELVCVGDIKMHACMNDVDDTLAYDTIAEVDLWKSKKLETKRSVRLVRRGKSISSDTNLPFSARSDSVRTGFHWA
jgi:hypothetical protein